VLDGGTCPVLLSAGVRLRRGSPFYAHLAADWLEECEVPAAMHGELLQTDRVYGLIAAAGSDTAAQEQLFRGWIAASGRRTARLAGVAAAALALLALLGVVLARGPRRQGCGDGCGGPAELAERSPESPESTESNESIPSNRSTPSTPTPPRRVQPPRPSGHDPGQLRRGGRGHGGDTPDVRGHPAQAAVLGQVDALVFAIAEVERDVEGQPGAGAETLRRTEER
jgi:hypothetical protein